MKKSQDIKTPKGFFFAVAEAAIKKPGKNDLALIFSAAEASIAGTFTTNAVKSRSGTALQKKDTDRQGTGHYSQQR